MDNGTSKLRQFGDFRLDPAKRVLWHRGEPVDLALKEIQLLCVLTEDSGSVVTKDEILDKVWSDSFVGDNNLSRHIYVLRKTFKDLGETDDLIQTVPRRGYRFTAETREIEANDIVFEKHTRTKTLIEYEEQRQPELKRARFVAYGMLAIALTGALAIFAMQYFRTDAPVQEIRSMAVLPFRLLGDNTTAHTGEGVADILTTRLSHIRDLSIRPTNSMTGLADLDAVSAGQRLQVDAVLEGTIYYIGERVRVTARLVRVSDASIVWSGEFERLKHDELSLHSELAMQIVPVIAANISADERNEIAKNYTENSDAYELYLRGRHEWNKRSRSGVVEAQRLFRNAIAADPNFALAYAGLADILLTSQPNLEEATRVLGRALELDPNLAEAHASRGFYLMFHEWDWDGAEAAFKRALELKPSYATAHHWYATLFAIRGDIPAAKAEMGRALELNPLSHNFIADLGQLHYFAGEYAEAEAYCRRALELSPDFAFAHEYLFYIYLKTGEFDKAVTEIGRSDDINYAFGHWPQAESDFVAKYRAVYAQSGINGYFEHKYPGTATAPETFYFHAIKHAMAGDNQKALDYLERSVDGRMFLAAFAKANPMFDGLRAERRYQEILRKMGLA